MSSKTLTQDEIDKILGIDYKMFKNVVALAVNYNKPFLALDAQSKRDIIETIFNVRILGEMLKVIKKKISIIKTDIEISNNEVKVLEETIKTLKKNLDEISRSKVKFEEDKINLYAWHRDNYVTDFFMEGDIDEMIDLFTFYNWNEVPYPEKAFTERLFKLGLDSKAAFNCKKIFEPNNIKWMKPNYWLSANTLDNDYRDKIIL
jgi:hypothetical protein